MSLIKNLIPESQYSTKCPYSMQPKGICIHNTANDAPAINERNYMARADNQNEVSFHIAIDDKEAIQCIPFNRNAWHAGDGGSGQGNRNYIAVEICYSKSGGDRFIKAEQRAAKEVASLLKQYGWGIDKVKKHQDFSNKYCPHRTLDMGWQRFLNMIQAELNNSKETNSTVTNTSNTTTSNNSKEVYRVRKSWEDSTSQIGAFSNLENAKKICKLGYSVYNSKGIEVYSNKEVKVEEEYITKKYSEKGTFTCTVDEINFRNNPIIKSDNKIVGQYYKGEKVNYDYVVITNKYVYISWISASAGVRRYMPVRDLVNKEVWGTFI